jgi:hypothetical protein
MYQEDEGVMVQKIFDQVRATIGVTSVSVPAPRRVLVFYAEELRAGRMKPAEIFKYFRRDALRENTIVEHPQPLSDAQITVIREMEGAMQHFFSLYGIQYPRMRVTAVPVNVFPRGVIATYCPFHAIMAIAAAHEDEWVLFPISLHERLHSVAAGFVPTRLNEGMTEYITTTMLMGRAGIEDASARRIWNFYYQTIGDHFKAQGLRAPGYLIELSTVLLIINYVDDDEQIIYAYLTGDTRPLEAALGPGVWQRIEWWASQFEGVSAGTSRTEAEAEKTIGDLQRYFEGIQQILQEAAQNAPGPQGPGESTDANI